VIAVQKNKIKQNRKSGWKLASGDSGAEPQKNTIKNKKNKKSGWELASGDSGAEQPEGNLQSIAQQGRRS